jgi:hypothetical protein
MSFIIIDDNLYKIEGVNSKLLSMGNKFLESRFDDTDKVKIKSKFKKLKKLEKLLNKNELENGLIYYYLLPYIWSIDNQDDLVTKEFKKFLTELDLKNLNTKKSFVLYFNNTEVTVGGKKIIKLNYKHLSILDELMYLGANKIFGHKYEQYTEHAGLIDISHTGKTDRLIINTNRNFSADDDKDILFNIDLPNLHENEIIFHTHPPTDGVYGRLDEDIIYELPSAEDILHFMENYNNGIVQKSLVITLEGYYIIQAKIFAIDTLTIEDENRFISKFRKIKNKIQKQAFKDHNITKKDFKKTLDYFHKHISINFLEELNKFLELFNIEIEFIQRKFNKKINKYIIGKLYLEIIPVEL